MRRNPKSHINEEHEQRIEVTIHDHKERMLVGNSPEVLASTVPLLVAPIVPIQQAVRICAASVTVSHPYQGPNGKVGEMVFS